MAQTAAARQKRRRTREAMGLAVYPVEIGGDVLSALEMAGLLRDSELIDRDKVSTALAKALAEWAREKLASRVTLIAGKSAYNGPRNSNEA